MSTAGLGTAGPVGRVTKDLAEPEVRAAPVDPNRPRGQAAAVVDRPGLGEGTVEVGGAGRRADEPPQTTDNGSWPGSPGG